jgi:hypothetical protein
VTITAAEPSALTAGVPHLPKPFGGEELIGAVTAALRAPPPLVGPGEAGEASQL